MPTIVPNPMHQSCMLGGRTRRLLQLHRLFQSCLEVRWYQTIIRHVLPYHGCSRSGKRDRGSPAGYMGCLQIYAPAMLAGRPTAACQPAEEVRQCCSKQPPARNLRPWEAPAPENRRRTIPGRLHQGLPPRRQPKAPVLIR